MFLNDYSECYVISSFIRSDIYFQSRKMFVLGILEPFHKIVLPSLSPNNYMNIQNYRLKDHTLMKVLDTVFSFEVTLIDVEKFDFNFFPDNYDNTVCKNEKQNLKDLLQIREHSSLSTIDTENIINILRSLGEINLNSTREIKKWLHESLKIVPSDIVNISKNYLINSGMVYLALLLFIASYGEYPIWLSNSLGEINKNSKNNKNSSFWVKKYMNTVLKNNLKLQRLVGRKINRSMDPIDLILYYLATIKQVADYSSAPSYSNPFIANNFR